MKKVEFRLGKWRIEPARNVICNGDIERTLEPRVMDTLVLLMSQFPATVTTDELMAAIWPGQVVEPGAVHRVINKLRAALDDSAKSPAYIETVSMRGYRMKAESTATTLAIEPVSMALLVDEEELGGSDQILNAPRKSVAFPRRLMAFGLIGLVCLALFAVWYLGLGSSPAVEQQIAPRSTAGKFSNWAPTIAILPFKQEGEGAQQLAAVLREQIVTDLTGPRLASTRRRFPLMAGGIKVLASSAVREQVVEDNDPAAIGKALDVKYLLSGVVNTIGDKSRILLRLIRTQDGEQIWSRTYTQQSLDVVKLASTISLNAGVYITERMPNDYWYRVLQDEFSTREAFLSFIFAHQGGIRKLFGEPEDLAIIAGNFEKALEGAPSHYFTNLYLARTYAEMMVQSLAPVIPMNRLDSLLNTLELFSETTSSNWKEANVKALRAANQLLKQDYQASYAAVKDTLETNPNAISAHAMLAEQYAYAGSLDGAIQEYQRAIEVGGSLPGIYIALAKYFALNGQADAGIALLEDNLDLVPAFSARCLMKVNQASLMLKVSRRLEAIDLAEEASAQCAVEQPSMFMTLSVELGWHDRAAGLLKREVVALDPDAISILDTYFLLGDIDQVLVWLKKGEGNIRVNSWISRKRRYEGKQEPTSPTLAQLLISPEFLAAESRLPSLVL